MPRIYKTNESSVTVLGVNYAADENGIIDIPDDKFSKSVYQQGWVLAKGIDAQLARQKQAVDVKPAVVKATAAELKPEPADAKTDPKATQK